MKTFFSIFLFLLLLMSVNYIFAETGNVKSSEKPITSLSANTQNTNLSPKMTESQFKEKITDLVNQRREVSLQIYKQRVELIQNDPALRILHKAILDLHEKMATQLNNSTKMVPLIDKGHAIDQQIQSLVLAYQNQQQQASK